MAVLAVGFKVCGFNVAEAAGFQKVVNSVALLPLGNAIIILLQVMDAHWAVGGETCQLCRVGIIVAIGMSILQAFHIYPKIKLPSTHFLESEFNPGP